MKRITVKDIACIILALICCSAASGRALAEPRQGGDPGAQNAAITIRIPAHEDMRLGISVARVGTGEDIRENGGQIAEEAEALRKKEDAPPIAIFSDEHDKKPDSALQTLSHSFDRRNITTEKFDLPPAASLRPLKEEVYLGVWGDACLER